MSVVAATLGDANTLSATLHDIAGSGRLVVAGSVSIDDAALAIAVSGAPAHHDAFLLIDNDGTDAITGGFFGPL